MFHLFKHKYKKKKKKNKKTPKKTRDSNESLFYCSRTQIIELLQELPLLDQVELLQYGYQ